VLLLVDRESVGEGRPVGMSGSSSFGVRRTGQGHWPARCHYVSRLDGRLGGTVYLQDYNYTIYIDSRMQCDTRGLASTVAAARFLHCVAKKLHFLYLRVLRQMLTDFNNIW